MCCARACYGFMCVDDLGGLRVSVMSSSPDLAASRRTGQRTAASPSPPAQSILTGTLKETSERERRSRLAKTPAAVILRPAPGPCRTMGMSS